MQGQEGITRVTKGIWVALGTTRGREHAFALMLRDARSNKVVVVGNVLICFLPTYVLFDTGSSHTFVSTQFFRKFNKEPEPLGYELVAS